MRSSLVGSSIVVKTRYKLVEQRFTVAKGAADLPPGNYRISVLLRFDDECGNGHNTFSITAQLYGGPFQAQLPQGEPVMCGAIHDIIERYVPEVAHLVKWHLCSTDGPMHYIVNTVYLAGDRDCHGKRKGEPWSFAQAVQFGSVPIKHKISDGFAKFLRGAAPAFDLEVLRIEHNDRMRFKPRFTFGGYTDKWHDCPFDTEDKALDFLHALQTGEPKFLEVPTQWSDGKKRELEYARKSAVWPEATDEELMQEPAQLEAALEARLPGLMERFKADMLAQGWEW